MIYVVTGAAGFIGYNLALSLAKDGHELYLYDRNWGQVSELEMKQLLSAGACYTPSWDAGFGRVDGVFHLASSIASKHIKTNPHEAISNNLEMMQNMLAYYENSGTKIVYSSSIEVQYGSSSVVMPTTEESPIVFEHPEDPRWAYAVSKFLPEMLLRTSSATWSIARFTNVFGPSTRNYYVTKAFMLKLLDGVDSLEVQNANETRCFVYVDDIVRGLRMMMDKPEANSQIITLGTDTPVTIAEWAQMIIDASDSKAVVVANHGANPEHRYVDITKAKTLLGWQPEISFHEGLERTWNYEENNR